MKDMLVGDFLLAMARRYPEKTAVVFRGQRFSYSELNERVNRLAHHLKGLGVQKGDRVGLMFFNSTQFVELFFATTKLGALAVPLNFRMVPREVKWCLDSTRCKVFAYDQAFAQQVDPVKKNFSTVEHLIFSGEQAPSGEHHYEAFVQEGIGDEPEVELAFDDPAYLIFTGGTTGSPKAAVHTHRGSFFDVIERLIRLKCSDPDEVTLSHIPMFHVAGLGLMKFTLAVGGTLVPVESFDPGEILKLIDREKATMISLLPPSTYIRIMDFPKIADYDTSSITRLLTSVASLPKPLMLRLFDTFPNADIYYGWGQTETGMGGALGRFTRAMVEKDSEKIKSVGPAFTFSEIKLVDDNGREVPVGEMGEAVVRSPSNMIGYFDQPELTSQTLKDGWVSTGDFLRKDADGFYYFMDRKKDMIKTGGENVFAQEVEGVILSHEAVENCAVIGLPDPQWGELVTAVIKLRQGFSVTEEEIQDHCKTSLSGYKKPRRVIFVDEYPVSDAGKVQKFKLREKYS